MEKIVLKWVLKNMLDFGQARPMAVLGKIIADQPEWKKQIPLLKEKIEKTIQKNKNLGREEIIQKLKSLDPEIFKEKKKEEREISLPEVKGKVVMRMAPSPSGPLHIGHALVLLLNYYLCQKYQGKLILRIEDTNPENIYLPAYQMIVDEAQWLTENKIGGVVVQSERLGFYYDYGEKLIEKGKAYVCSCHPDKFRELVNQKKACPCRLLEKKEHLIRYEKMFSEYKPGEAVLRFKSNLNLPNPALRDFPLMRINDYPHPKNKEAKVWPLMNFSVAVDDYLLKVTHTLRGKDHQDNARKQEMISQALGWSSPVALFIGRINFEDMELSSSQTRLAIERGIYSGWDDIRLPTIAALRKRGYQPKAFLKWALGIGINETDKTVSREEFFKSLNAFNKEIIDAKANRYFMISQPRKIVISNALERKIKLKLHPDFPERGYREFLVNKNFLIEESDFQQLEEKKIHRLMDCLNFERKGKKFVFLPGDFHEHKKAENKGKIIHWLPEKGNVEIKIRLEENSLIKCLAEPSVEKIKEKEIVQFERFGFCSLTDKKEFWFLHR